MGTRGAVANLSGRGERKRASEREARGGRRGEPGPWVGPGRAEAAGGARTRDPACCGPARVGGGSGAGAGAARGRVT